MPELPEVETIKRSLEKQVRARVIVEVICGSHRGFRFSESELKASIEGQSIEGLARRGKYLVFELELYFCIFHLGMTGQLTLRDPCRKDSGQFFRNTQTGLQSTRQHPVDRHTHLQFRLDNGKSILFRDTRKFGKVALVPGRAEDLQAFFSHLGLEPFSPDYEWSRFSESLQGRKGRMKSLLLDQSFVAGVGNIYADEALFEAGIHPARRVHHLRRYEKQSLFDAIPAVLEKGIQFGGTTLRDFITSDGDVGSNQERLNVYGRKSEPCHRCQTLIQKIVIGQRGTHFCPTCQPRRFPRKDVRGRRWPSRTAGH